jgi:nickel-type superoxide dismutase maturation protease
MSPALRAGDFLIATRSRRLARGSVVVVEHPARPGYEMVKRLVGLPGDLIDGRRIDFRQRWVLGDNPSASTDSRHFGAVGEEAVRGVVRLRYWPPSRFRVFG